MVIRLNELSPHIARIVEEEARVLAGKRSDEPGLSTEERTARAALERLGEEGQLSFVPGLAVPLAMALLVVGTYAAAYVSYAASAVGVPLTFASFIGLVGYISKMETGRAERFTAESIRALVGRAPRTRTDEVYCEALLLLASPEMPLEEPARRDILRQLNELLEDRLRIDAHRERVRKLMETNDVALLEQERRRLETRIATTGDPIALASLMRSRDLCDTRLEHARALGPMLERLAAQHEAVHQALASTHLALARLQVAPSTLAAPSVAEIYQTVTRIGSQTRAIEEAVAEVAALRG